MKRFASLTGPGICVTNFVAWVLAYHGIVNAPPEPDLFAWVCMGLMLVCFTLTFLGVLGQIDRGDPP